MCSTIWNLWGVTKMLNDEIKGAVETALWKVREANIPRRAGVKLKHPNAPTTGNLKFNATKVVHEAEQSRIYVDENIAPYMPYTNEPWISPKWKGAKNPNENWFATFTEILARQLSLIHI